jgi:type IV pilus assembly protein PilN
MLKMDINLASRPFVNHRKFYLAVLGLGLLLLLTTGWNLQRYQYVRDHQKIAQVKFKECQARLDTLQKEEAIIRARLHQGSNAEFLDKITFLNLLIAQRTFSWTELLNDLESLLPANVQIASIRPRIAENQMTIEIIANTRTNQDAIEFVANLENSGHFKNVHPIFEDITKTPGMTGKQIAVAVSYGKQI